MLAFDVKLSFLQSTLYQQLKHMLNKVKCNDTGHSSVWDRSHPWFQSKPSNYFTIRNLLILLQITMYMSLRSVRSLTIRQSVAIVAPLVRHASISTIPDTISGS